MKKLSETKLGRFLLLGIVIVLTCVLAAGDCMAQRRANRGNGGNGLLRRRATVTPITPAPSNPAPTPAPADTSEEAQPKEKETVPGKETKSAETEESILDKTENEKEVVKSEIYVKAENVAKDTVEEFEKDNPGENLELVIENTIAEVMEGAVDSSVNEALSEAEEAIAKKEAAEKEVGEVVNIDEAPDSVKRIVEESGIEESEVEEALENQEAELQPMENVKLRMVKMSELDGVLKIPDDADFDGLAAFVASLEQIRPSDLEVNDPEVQEKQVNEFIQKLLEMRVATAEKMLTLENLKEDQWETAVSLKVQTFAMLFRVNPIYVEKLRKFTQEIRERASADLFWNVEAVLIQMELCQFETEPSLETLKQHVERMLTHTKKGIELKCLNADFALAAVQMVLLTQDKLTKADSERIFAEAVEILNSSDSQQLKDTAKLLENIQKQRRLKGKTVDLTLTTHDGKTIKTADYVGKTLLLYCFSFDSQESVQDLGLIYQFYMAYNARGLEVIGLVSGKKNPEMEELLKQIPWSMTFIDSENMKGEESPFEKLAVSMFPCKVLVNTTGVVENPNVDSMSLMKYLQAIYGAPVEDVEKTEEATSETDVEVEIEMEEAEE